MLYMRDWKLDVINFCASFALDLRTQDKFGNEADIVDHVTFYSRRVSAAVHAKGRVFLVVSFTVRYPLTLVDAWYIVCCVCCGPLANQLQGACSLDHSRVLLATCMACEIVPLRWFPDPSCRGGARKGGGRKGLVNTLVWEPNYLQSVSGLR